MKPKQYRIKPFGQLFVVQQRTELNWETISIPMCERSANFAHHKLTNPNESTQPAQQLESDVLPEQGGLSRSVAASEVVC